VTDPKTIRDFEHAGWERAAETYEASFAMATRQFVAELLDAARVEAGGSVLDVACGPGFVAAAAAERTARVRGVDFSEAMLSVARRRHPGIMFDRGDAEDLPYPDNGFDSIVCNFGIHHVPRPTQALHQMYRVLRQRGHAAFTIWAAPAHNVAWKLVQDAIQRRGNPEASNAPPPGGGFSSPADCTIALQRAGFAEVEVQQLGGIWQHADGQALLNALRAGTARMAALIEAQDPTRIPAIAAEIDLAAAAYRNADGLALPVAAFVTSGIRL